MRTSSRPITWSSAGGRILVERTVEGSGGKRWTEAYPDAEVVASDADGDLAVVRLNGVSADHFASLPLAVAPVADEDVLAWGFPASSLASRSGLVSKPGKVPEPRGSSRSSIGAPGEVIRNNATDGLLISSEIEPGFSGGPALDARGQVVGVNVTKDTVHRAQNGAVSVALVRQLLATVPPRGKEKEPTADDVRALLTRIQSEYLLLPVDRRVAAREDDYVSRADLPRLQEMGAALRRLEDDGSRHPKTKLSGWRVLGLVLVRSRPGRPLETAKRTAARARAPGRLRDEGEEPARVASGRSRAPAAATCGLDGRRRARGAAARSRCGRSRGT